MNAPLVSVLMPVYNAEKYLHEAIKSILNQSFINFEFIIINDGSTDNSLAIIESYSDKRIVLISNETNLGIIETLNRGIDLAKGRYIARMDADDISKPERFEKQVNFLEQNKKIAIVGSAVELINNSGFQTGKVVNSPETGEKIRSRMLFQCAFVHSSIMGKTSVFKTFQYSKDYPIAEDFYLWVKLTEQYSTANLKEVLVFYRVHETNISANPQKLILKIASLRKIFKYQFKQLGFPITAAQVETHLEACSIVFSNFHKTLENYKKVYHWLTFLKAQNHKSDRFPTEIFHEDLSLTWYRYCLRNAKFGRFSGFLFYLNSNLKTGMNLKLTILLFGHSIGNYRIISPVYSVLKKYLLPHIKLKI